MKNVNELVPIEQNFLMNYTSYLIFENMLLEDKDKAIEYMQALCRYCFFGEEYEGKYSEVRNQLIQQSVGIDMTKIKYQKATSGGKANAKVTDEELWRAWISGEFKSKAELGRHFGITGQAVGQRLRKLEANPPIIVETHKRPSFESESESEEPTEEPSLPLSVAEVLAKHRNDLL